MLSYKGKLRWYCLVRGACITVFFMLLTSRIAIAPVEVNTTSLISTFQLEDLSYEFVVSNDDIVEIPLTEASQVTTEYVTRGERMYLDGIEMRATAYDLSIQSTGKSRTCPAYGITKSGTRATKGRTVAVDRDVIPLGSKLYIDFPELYDHMDGYYVAEDIGGAIDGNEIDIFFGEDLPGETKVLEQALKFGVRQVVVYIINRN